jgi:hypothetical protein
VQYRTPDSLSANPAAKGSPKHKSGFAKILVGGKSATYKKGCEISGLESAVGLQYVSS